MSLRSFTLVATGAIASLSFAVAPAQAQLGDLGGIGKSVLGSALPDASSVGIGNATGLLGYCLKNKLMRTVGIDEGANGTNSGGGLADAVAGAVGGVTGTTTTPAPTQPATTSGTGSTVDLATTVFDKLRGRKGVAKSPGYLAGSKGVLQTSSTALPIGNLGSQVKGKVCDMVLGRAKDFL